MEYVIAFVIGGLICLVGQFLLDVLKLTPVHMMSFLVVVGALFDGFHLYDRLVDFAGAGAFVPITYFGHSLVHGAMAEGNQYGFLGVGMGIFEVTSVILSTSILFGFLIALVFKPKG